MPCRLCLVLMVILVAGTVIVTTGQASAEETLYYESRADIPLAYRWNLTDIFPTTEAFDAAYERLEAEIPKLAAYQGTLGDSPERFAEALELLFSIDSGIDDIEVYANEWLHTDTRDPEANRYAGRASALRARFAEAAAYVKPEVAQLPDAAITAILAHEQTSTYDHLIDDIVRTRKHIRSQEVEEVLAASAQLRSAPQKAYSALASADLTWPMITGEDGKQVRVVPALYYSFMASQNRQVRKDAALALFGTLAAHGNTFAATLAGSIYKDVWLARTRGYDSSMTAALDKINVPRTVMDTLVATVHENLEAVHRYVALRKKVLGIDDFHIYDLYVSMVPAAERTYTFDEGWDLAMSFWKETFGEEYAKVAARGRSERWIDVYSNTGKRGGAYAWGSYNTHPYLFLNWGGQIDDVFTLVHEMGHAIHRHLANQHQPYHDANYALFVAEVASVASESLFFEWLLDRTEDRDERLALLNLRMNSITGTFLRQIFFHEVEARAHAMAEAGKPLTKESLGQVWGELWTEYYGPEAVLDEEFRAGWSRIPHLYRTFYVWVYASSFAAGEAIAGRVREGDMTAVDDYLETLKLGGSIYPMAALERAGVDMTSPDVITTVMTKYREILTEMEGLLLPQ